MWFLYILSWLGILVQLSFIVLSVAAGLYYIAELIEEYTAITCRIIRILILEIYLINGMHLNLAFSREDTKATCLNSFNWYGSMTLIVFLFALITMAIFGGMSIFEDFPASMIICGIFSQVMHLLVLRTFPFFDLTSLPFIASVVFIVINHYLAFWHFSSVFYPFSEILAYFTLCLWLVPFAFFVSLSANENILPTIAETRPLNADESDVVTNYFSRRSKRYGLLSFFNYAKESILPQRVKKSF